MKGKVVSILTVGLVTLAVLSPEIIVFGIIWQQHLELDKIPNTAATFTSLNVEIPNTYTYLKFTENKSVLHSFETNQELNAVSFVQELSTLLNKYNFFLILQRVLLFIPIGIAISIFLYDRYLIYRAAIYKEQVDMLEKMWHYQGGGKSKG